MKIRIDADRCEGHGRCWDISPGVVEPDDLGRGRVIAETVPVGLESQARDAANVCPERAVGLED